MSDQPIGPGSWEPWSARPELMPKCVSDEPCWSVESTGEPSCHGGWDLHWHHLVPENWYRVDFACRAFDVPHPHDNLHAELIWWRNDNRRAGWSHFRFTPRENNIYEFQHEGQAPADATSANLRLMLPASSMYTVRWKP